MGLGRRRGTERNGNGLHFVPAPSSMPRDGSWSVARVVMTSRRAGRLRVRCRRLNIQWRPASVDLPWVAESRSARLGGRGGGPG